TYAFSPDGRSIFFLTESNSGSRLAALSFIEAAHPTSTPKTLIGDGLEPRRALREQGFFSPSGKYLIVGARASAQQQSPDLHVFEAGSGALVFQRGRGAFDYIQKVTPNDTLIFQDTVGGTQPNSPPLQTLFQVPLATAPVSQPTAIDVQTAEFDVTA